MDTILWRLHDSMHLAWVVIFALVVSLCLLNVHYIPVVFRTAFRRLVSGNSSHTPKNMGNCPTGLVIIPSLLRNEEDYTAIIATVESCASNQYPNDLYIIVSIDGKNENQKLFAQLANWLDSRSYSNTVKLHLTYDEVRRSKMMAIDRGAQYMKALVASGAVSSFPTIYFSIDADSILSEQALNRMASQLNTPHPITGNKRRTIAGTPMVHSHVLWQGWRSFFTIENQIYLNVARMFMMSGVARSNLGVIPYIGVPGAIYATWSEILLDAPKFMGYIRSITFIDWLRWWVGIPLPTFAESSAEPIPQLLTGNTDDTSMAVVISISTWQDNRFVLELPRSPLHAFGRLLRSWFIERTHNHDPESKAYTYVPPSIKGLWLQRKRWNSSRIELNLRFSKAFLFCWDTGFPFMFQLSIVGIIFFRVLLTYVIIPFVIFGEASNVFYCLMVGMTLSFICNLILTLTALAMDTERRRYWAVLLALPTAGLFSLVFGATVGIWGFMKDVLWKGNNVKFTPASTLITGGSQRIAIAFRVQRFLSMCIRSLRYGDVPFGLWWGSWYERVPYVRNGYADWSNKKNSQYVLK